MRLAYPANVPCEDKWRRWPLDATSEVPTACAVELTSAINTTGRHRWPSLLHHDLDAAVLRLAHAVAGRCQRPALARADYHDRLRRNAIAHQRVLDDIGAPERQRHVVRLRPRGVGVAGGGDAGVAVGLVEAGGLADRAQRLRR